MPWVCCVGTIIDNRLTRELPWDHVMEDSETISSCGVSMVVLEDTYLFVFWADTCVSRRSDGVLLEIVPIAISIRSGSMVSNEVIIWIGDPNTSWGLIGVE